MATDISVLRLLLQYFVLTDLSALLVLFFPRLLCKPLIIPGGLN